MSRTLLDSEKRPALDQTGFFGRRDRRVLYRDLTSDYQKAVLADKPVSYWRFGEVAGTIARDIGSGAFPGIYIAAPTLGGAGGLIGDSDKAVAFNGSTQYVDVASFTEPATDTFSLEALVQWTSGGGIIMSRGTNMWSLYVNATGTIGLDKSNVSTIVTSTTALTSGVWAHVVATKSGATSHLYINAVDVTGVVTDATMVANWNQVGIGAGRAGGTPFLNGSIDEPAVYNAALAPARVQAHYVAAGYALVAGGDTAIFGGGYYGQAA